MAMTKVKNLQMWCKKMADGYRDVEVRDMDKSWKSGLAFCAIIHRFRPDLIDYDSLSKENVFENNNLAFEVAEKKLGIPAFLEAADMVAIRVPDKLSVVTYVSQYYNYFRDKAKEGGPEVNKYAGRVERKETVPAEDKSLTPVKTNTPQVENGKTATIRDKCSICSDKVYLLERQIEAGKLYHRTCFRNSELSPTSKVFKRHSVDPDKDLTERKHRKLEPDFGTPEKKPNFGQQRNQAPAKQDDTSKMELTVNNDNKATDSEVKSSEVAKPVKDVQKKQDAAAIIGKVLPGFGSDAPTNETKLPKRNKVNIAEKLKELEEQNLRNSTAANAAVLKNDNHQAGVSDKSNVFGKDLNSNAKRDIESQPKPKPRTNVVTTPEKMDTNESVGPSLPTPVPRFQKSSDSGSPKVSPRKELNRSKSPVEKREKKITPPVRPKTEFVPHSMKDTLNTSLESTSSVPPLPSSSLPKVPVSQPPKLPVSRHKNDASVSPKASPRQPSPTAVTNNSTSTSASGLTPHKPPSKPPRVSTAFDNQSNAKPMETNEIHEPAKTVTKGPAIGHSAVLVVPKRSEDEKKNREVVGGLLKSLADVRNKQETVGDVKTHEVAKSGHVSDSTQKFSEGAELREQKLGGAKVQPQRPKTAFVPSTSSVVNDTTISSPTNKKSITSNVNEGNNETKTSDNGSDVPEWKRKLEERKMQNARPKSADLLNDNAKSEVQVLDWQKEAEKRKEARKGSYIDPENFNTNNEQQGDRNNEHLRKPVPPKTGDSADKYTPDRPEKGPSKPERPKTTVVEQREMNKTSPKLSVHENPMNEPANSPERKKIHVNDAKLNGSESKDDETQKKKIAVDKKFKFEAIDVKKAPEKPPAPSVLPETPKSTKPYPARPPPPTANASPTPGRQHISPEQIQRQLRLIDSKLTMLEIKGRKLEDTIRNASDEDDELMISWFQLVNEKNDLVRMENDFIYLNREQELEVEQDEVEHHLRRLVETPEDLKTDEDRNEEEQLLEKKMDIINQRNKIVDSIDQDRLRYLEEDHEIEAMLKIKGFSKGSKEGKKVVR